MSNPLWRKRRKNFYTRVSSRFYLFFEYYGILLLLEDIKRISNSCNRMKWNHAEKLFLNDMVLRLVLISWFTLRLKHLTTTLCSNAHTCSDIDASRRRSQPNYPSTMHFLSCLNYSSDRSIARRHWRSIKQREDFYLRTLQNLEYIQSNRIGKHSEKSFDRSISFTIEGIEEKIFLSDMLYFTFRWNCSETYVNGEISTFEFHQKVRWKVIIEKLYGVMENLLCNIYL